MNSGTLVAATPHLDPLRVGLRRASVVAALAIVLSLFVLVQKPAEAAPSTAGSVGAAQIDFRQFTCPILLELRAEYADSPFFASVVPIIDEILVEFGCIPGTTTTTVAPTTTTTLPPTTTTTIGVPPTIPPGFIGLSCETLIAIRASFVGGPFAVFIPIIDIALAAFGCVPPSG